MSQEKLPTEIKRMADGRLQISWSDATSRIYTAAGLRKSCPCATCREKKTEEPEVKSLVLPVLSLEEAQPLEIRAMQPVGNYAYNIVFSDGHDAGIYTFDYLSNLGE